MRKLVIWVHSLLILAIAAGLRLWRIKWEGPSFEEMLASLTASRAAGDYLASSYLDFCPPVLYAMLHPLAESELTLWILRLPSVAAGSAAAVLAYVAGRQLFTHQIGLIAGYLLALSPLHVYFSQEVEPVATASFVFLTAILFCIRAAETNMVRDWAIYDICTLAMLYLWRESPFVVITLPLLQLSRALFFPPADEERRIRRSSLLQAIAFNHVLIAAAALPWISISTTKLPWPLPKPDGGTLLRVFSDHYLTGLSDMRWTKAPYLVLFLYVLLIPPLVRILRRPDFRSFAVLGGLILAVGIPFVYSLLETSRFDAPRIAAVTLPFFILTSAVLIGRCNPVIRLVLFLSFSAVFIAASIKQTLSLQKTSWTAMRNAVIASKPQPQDLAVFWPDYAVEVSKYWDKVHGQTFRSVPASELLTKWADIPEGSRFFFISSQFPSREPHLHTLQGALHQFANSEVLYKERLNSVTVATDLNETRLAQWYKNPESLAVYDQPTSQTQFLFAANDPLFKGPSFHTDRPDVSYDADGRRGVWTKTSHVDLNPTVTLAPGFYVVKVHCAPDFEQPEQGRQIERTVSVELMTGADRKKVQLTEETTIKLTTSTDNELRNLKLSLDTTPMLNVPAPDGGSFGIKIYSIAIDQAEVAEE